MATDATGTPTSLGIPKYNTSADAPSGLGFNAAMDAIDALIAARVSKPSGISTGEAAVWNGSGWDRSSVTRIGVTSLGSGTPDATKFLRGDGSWQLPSGGVTWTYALTPPGSPADGDVWIYADSLTLPTVQWMFRFHSGSSNTDKWEFVGGVPVTADVTNTTVTNVAYADFASVPSVTVPRAGVYKAIYSGAAALLTGATAHVSLKKGASATADAESINVTATTNWITGKRAITVSGLSASDVLKLQGKISAGTLTMNSLTLEVVPVRVS